MIPAIYGIIKGWNLSQRDHFGSLDLVDQLLADEKLKNVKSAVEGLESIVPNLPTIPIVIVILSLLFFQDHLCILNPPISCTKNQPIPNKPEQHY